MWQRREIERSAHSYSLEECSACDCRPDWAICSDSRRCQSFNFACAGDCATSISWEAKVLLLFQSCFVTSLSLIIHVILHFTCASGIKYDDIGIMTLPFRNYVPHALCLIADCMALIRVWQFLKMFTPGHYEIHKTYEHDLYAEGRSIFHKFSSSGALAMLRAYNAIWFKSLYS